MIDKCPNCKEKIDILLQQDPNPSTTIGTLTYTQITRFNYGPTTTKIYKCSNSKCWVTKIKESWE